MRVHELDIINHHPSLTLRFMNIMQFSHFAPLETICYSIIDQHNLWNYKAGGGHVSMWAMQSYRRGHNFSSSSVQVLHSLISYYLPTTQWIVDTLICLASTLFKLCSKLSTESEFYLCWDVTFVKSFAKYALPKTFLAF